MGDAGEGIVDNEARISERREELERERREKRQPPPANPEQTAAIQSLKLARAEVQRQLNATSHDARRTTLTAALADLDKKIAAFDG